MNSKGFREFAAIEDGKFKYKFDVKPSEITAIGHSNSANCCTLFLNGSNKLTVKGSYDEIVKDLFGDTLK